MANLLPLFYYSGSKRHGIASDLAFIEHYLSFMPVRVREIVSAEYSEIYKRHFNKREYRLARYEANRFLKGMAAEYLREAPKHNHESDEKSAKWLRERIDKVRAAQKSTRKRIF